MNFNLKKIWYVLIKEHKKKIEYREVKPYWSKRFGKVIFNDQNHIFKEGDVIDNLNINCLFILGYTKENLSANIKKIEVIDGKNTDLKYNGLVFAIHFELIEK